MATVMSLAAHVSAGSDPQKASEFLKKYMDAIFPEVEAKGQHDMKAMIKELQRFSEKEVSLVPTKGGFSLRMVDKKKG